MYQSDFIYTENVHIGLYSNVKGFGDERFTEFLE